jgi:hypothetical protein
MADYELKMAAGRCKEPRVAWPGDLRSSEIVSYEWLAERIGSSEIAIGVILECLVA